MGKTYRDNVDTEQKHSKNNKHESLRRDMERKEKALLRTLETMQEIRKGYTIVELFVVIFFILTVGLGLSLMGGFGYVLVHFLQKIW